jgi:hypothetical protein
MIRGRISIGSKRARLLCAATFAGGALLLVIHAAQAGIGQPAGLHNVAAGQSPALPYLAWSAVRGADHYQLEVAADPSFKAPIFNNGTGDFTTSNTRATLTKTLPSHRYWWRIRAVSKDGATSNWSTSSFVTTWTRTVQRDSSGGPNVLRWRPLAGAVSYSVEISLDQGFGSIVGRRPATTSANSLSLPVTLPANTYYWRVTPLDAEGNRGKTSPGWKFAWSGPASTSSLSATNAITAADVSAFGGYTADQWLFTPHLAWKAAAGAVQYEVEINPDKDWAVGSRVCCTGTTVATAFTPTISLRSNRYYWRVRPLDAAGNAGPWFPAGPGTDTDSFTKTFDNGCTDILAEHCIAPPLATIRNLRVENADGSAVAIGGGASSPVLRWDPVPGASSYDYDVVRNDPANGGCQWSTQPNSSEHWSGFTATPAWTPLGASTTPPFPARNVVIATDGRSVQPFPTHSYCARVRARTDRGAGSTEVEGDYTYLPSSTAPAFTFTGYPGGVGSTPSFLAPQTGATATRMPVFTWRPVTGAQSYWIIVAKDASFTNLVDYAVTRVPAYAPRAGRTSKTYPDETTAYYWVVLPSTDPNGRCSGSCGDPLSFAHGTFQKEVQPAVRSLNRTTDITPTFDWDTVEGARRYELEVSTDPHFGSSSIDKATTVATTYTASRGYPANKQLYWRVRADDENLTGLTWSEGKPFQVRLVAPNHLRSEGSAGIPTWRWNPVSGAASYDIHVDLPNGSHRDFSRLPVPAFTATTMTGTGIFRWRVRANFPSRSGTTSGPYSTVFTYRQAIWQPTGTRSIGGAHNLVLRWNTVFYAKKYRVQISARRDFQNAAENMTTDNASYAPVLGSRYRSGGVFYWRVAAVDASSNTGPFTLPKQFSQPKPAKASR